MEWIVLKRAVSWACRELLSVMEEILRWGEERWGNLCDKVECPNRGSDR